MKVKPSRVIRPICDGRIPVQCINSRGSRVFDRGVSLHEDGVDVGALDPAGLRRCGRESDEIDEVDGGASPVEQTYEVDERVAAMVVARCSERRAPRSRRTGHTLDGAAAVQGVSRMSVVRPGALGTSSLAKCTLRVGTAR